MKTKKIKYEALLNEFGKKRIPYTRLLDTEEWTDKREKIIKRDLQACKKCSRGPTDRVGKDEYFGFEWVEYRDSNFSCLVDVEEMYWSDKPYHMQVHHRLYILDRVPWDYPDDALITLCNWCHQEVHDRTVIPVFGHSGEALGYTPCHRCHGSGSFPEYNHVQNGVCFNCGGARYEELIGK